ncbi:MAG: anti-sigma factor family protein, partial [Planctomycetota bacterium]
MSDHETCQDRREAIAALVLGELDKPTADQLQAHMESCPVCQQLYEALSEEETTIQSAFEAIGQKTEATKDRLCEKLSRNTQQPIFDEPATSPKSWQSSTTIKRITYFAAAAVIILAVSLFNWFDWGQYSSNRTKPMTCFQLLGQVCAAEQALFTGESIIHIINEIIVYPAKKDASIDERYERMKLTPQCRNYLKTVNSWLDNNWLPMCSLQADGQFGYNQLMISADIDQIYTITDQAWYEPATGQFARVMKTGEQFLFANSYDGKYVYSSETIDDGSFQLVKSAVAESFSPPQNPAEFLGITAGLRSTVQEDDFYPIQEVTEANLDDGTPVLVYKAGFKDLLGDVNTYWLFKVRQNDDIVSEMEFVLAGSTQMVIRRILSESVGSAEISWNLAEIDKQDRSVKQNSTAVVQTNTIILNVSVQHMVENADFETYLFA